MLSNDLAMEVNENLSIGAHHPLILIACEQLPTVYASVYYWGALILPIR